MPYEATTSLVAQQLLCKRAHRRSPMPFVVDLTGDSDDEEASVDQRSKRPRQPSPDSGSDVVIVDEAAPKRPRQDAAAAGQDEDVIVEQVTGSVSGQASQLASHMSASAVGGTSCTLWYRVCRCRCGTWPTQGQTAGTMPSRSRHAQKTRNAAPRWGAQLLHHPLQLWGVGTRLGREACALICMRQPACTARTART